ncbi:hypothetical protein [Flagellimonas allohymeniacidonis]|uniref:DUF922 domain-containing protein n=1 Tax=Flagellimonas allohymeniacidonis TaxID=2517819 RepID=A0A4Q8QGW7_9FLAO|nr:hypothetical protein [Allomuricauda hymeniacidonis]TAI48488.1 hypothetical protein EW142_01400 [Allomuricauda hymeniacidonis]
MSKDYKKFFTGLLVLNLICLVTPDRIVYKLRKSDRYFWSEKPLDLSHFRIWENAESDTTAMVHPMITGQISKVYNYPAAVLFTSDEIGKSWIDTASFDDSSEDQRALSELLEHEKRHFDITEIYRRKAQDSVNQMIFSSYMEKYKVIEYFFAISDSIQHVFDSESEHGLNAEQSEKWNELMARELYKNP